MSTFNTLNVMDPSTMQIWTNGCHIVQCNRIIPETHDVITFSFKMQQPVLFFFKPGQFVTLELEINGERVMRTYTISSSPSNPYNFSITVKRIPHGLVSNWLHKNLKVNDQIMVHGPMGQFNCLDFPAKKTLLLSGGVGITPVMSMARWWFDTDSNVDMIFAHSSRKPKDIIYFHELNYMSTRLKNFKLHLICENNDVGEIWGGYRGYLNQEMLKMIAPDFLERRIFCCGPESYMNAVKKILKSTGFNMEYYHEESFNSLPTQKNLTEKKSNNLIKIRIPEINLKKEISSGLKLIDAVSQVGINIPKACGLGICGTCRVKVLEGNEFNMNHKGGISDEEIKNGYVLSCCTIINGNISIEL